MGWRQNMGIGMENTISIPKSNKSNKSKAQENELIKTNIADIADTALNVQKVRTLKIAIKKMSICLHGSRCRFISLVDDRQICSKKNQPIFDMYICPDGKWERSQNNQNTQKKMTCYSCGSQTFWRKKDNQGGRWICSECHPPVLSKDEIEWL